MDRKQFEEWFKTTDAYKLLEEMNYFKIDLFIFKEHRSQYQHTTVQIAYMTWQYRFTRMVELEAAVDSLSDENAHFRNKKWDQNEDLTKLQAKVEGLQKRVEDLERKLQIKTRHCEFFEQSRKGHRSLAIHRKKQINSALEQIEKLYSKAESDYEKDRNPYYDGMLSALDLAEQAVRGELEEQALKGEGQ